MENRHDKPALVVLGYASRETRGMFIGDYFDGLATPVLCFKPFPA